MTQAKWSFEAQTVGIVKYGGLVVVCLSSSDSSGGKLCFPRSNVWDFFVVLFLFLIDFFTFKYENAEQVTCRLVPIALSLTATRSDSLSLQRWSPCFSINQNGLCSESHCCSCRVWVFFAVVEVVNRGRDLS